MRARLTEDMKTAMKSGDKERLGTIRLMQSAIKDLDIANRTAGKEAANSIHEAANAMVDAAE